MSARLPATKPPMVYDFESLDDFRTALLNERPILVSIDFENVDHITRKGVNPFEKMSEMGLAIYDTRKSPTAGDTLPNSSTPQSSNQRLETLARSIVAEHVITKEHRNKTELTCNAGFHHKVGHHARPYHCRFTKSTFLTRKETMSRLSDIIKTLSTQNLSTQETAAGARRNIKLIVWAAYCEVETFYHGGLDLVALCPTLQLWDFQKWSPFSVCFGVPQTGAEKAFTSLGVLNAELAMHNGCNDSVVQLVGFLRFMVMTEPEWSAWFNHREDLAVISFTWVDWGIYERNIALAPWANPRVVAMNRGREEKANRNGQKGGRQEWKKKSQPPLREELSVKGASSSPSRRRPGFLVPGVEDLTLIEDTNRGMESPEAGWNSTTSESSVQGTGWPKGIDEMSDWSVPSLKPTSSSDDNNDSSSDENGPVLTGCGRAADDVEENDGAHMQSHCEVTVGDERYTSGDVYVTSSTSSPFSMSGHGRRNNRRRRYSMSESSSGSVVWEL
ncbi:hypothetical protein B0T20DRAFT_349347 [Sordaria brevicollis]|uniref:Gfd2/YDR514C-like C-terminal domain-containing protein n=1 Tax=Sordaria brevicollis TaxID=83679 RepID=A0AAE0PHS6_SORBR|nr:hypothetical protein B0T20DRAFT_349347 [Sordaria brevicollis]